MMRCATLRIVNVSSKQVAAIEVLEKTKYSLNSLLLRPPLPLIEGVSNQEQIDWLKTVKVADARDSISGCCALDFECFVQMFGVVQRATENSTGELIGVEPWGNPHYSIMRRKKSIPVDRSLGYYFGDQIPKSNAYI
jgi:hypothetical protein